VDWSLSQWPTGFLQCFDAVGWVIWSVKIVPEMTYKVSSGTLSLYSLTSGARLAVTQLRCRYWCNWLHPKPHLQSETYVSSGSSNAAYSYWVVWCISGELGMLHGLVGLLERRSCSWQYRGSLGYIASYERLRRQCQHVFTYLLGCLEYVRCRLLWSTILTS